MCVQETSSTDSDKRVGEKHFCGEEGRDGDHSILASQSKTNGSRRGKGKKTSNHDSVSPESTDKSTSDAFEVELQLPGNI